MKIVSVSLSCTIPTGAFMNDKVGMEATLEPGESEFEALHALSSRIERWHKENKPHLYQESKPPTHMQGGEAWISAPVNALPQVIDLKEVRAKEELEDQILFATSLNE